MIYDPALADPPKKIISKLVYNCVKEAFFCECRRDHGTVA
jgi:hypothetical protein